MKATAVEIVNPARHSVDPTERANEGRIVIVTSGERGISLGRTERVSLNRRGAADQFAESMMFMTRWGADYYVPSEVLPVDEGGRSTAFVERPGRRAEGAASRGGARWLHAQHQYRSKGVRDG